jgi:hypothetical protein
MIIYSQFFILNFSFSWGGLLWPNFLYEKATAPGRTLNSSPWASGFCAVSVVFFKKKAHSSSQKPLAHGLSFPLASLPR